MTLDIFSFENSKVRTLDTAQAPLCVAIDICTSLGAVELSQGNRRSRSP